MSGEVEDLITSEFWAFYESAARFKIENDTARVGHELRDRFGFDPGERQSLKLLDAEVVRRPREGGVGHAARLGTIRGASVYSGIIRGEDWISHYREL